jgi:hypothetical protein
MAGPVAGRIDLIEQGCDRLGQIGVTGSPGQQADSLGT